MFNKLKTVVKSAMILYSNKYYLNKKLILIHISILTI